MVKQGWRRAAASRSRPTASPGKAASDSGLHGWAGIEDHMFKSDTLWVDDASEDIDTLLVFAGLFSAILTAFVVETYPMLQGDDSATTNQLLALGVSAQLGATGQMTTPAINATLLSLADPPSFTPSTGIRWINILFFLSLVLSLAAALFGILAKQWLREYIAWNSPLADPRENVIVRQERFEDWETWNVAATISAIPALLELAMILFLVGVTVLLWTLDDIVAIVVTVAVAAFLGAVSAFTILPIFFRRCPYRSPTAWACLRLVDFMRCTIILLVLQTARWLLRSICSGCYHASLARRLGRMYGHFAINPSRYATQASWREADLGKRDVDPPWWRRGDALEAAMRELEYERRDIDSDGNFTEQFRMLFPDEDDMRLTVRNITDSTSLLRALSWVYRASQDESVQQYISEALQTFHPAPPCHTSNPMGPDLVADWYLLLAMEHNELKHPLRLLHPSAGSGSSDGPSPLTSLRKGAAIFTRGNIIYPYTSRETYIPQFADHLDVHLPVLIGIIASDMAHCMSFLREIGTSKASPFADIGYKLIMLSVRRAYELFSVLRDLLQHRGMKDFRSPSVLRGLWSILSDGTVKQRLDVYAPSLRIHAFKLACDLNAIRVSIDLHENTVELTESKTTIPDYTHFVVNCAHDPSHSLRTASESDIGILIHALRHVQTEYRYTISPTTAGDVLDVIQTIADAMFSIRVSDQKRIVPGMDASSWIDSLWVVINGTLSGLYRPKFRRLLHTLEKCFWNGFFTGDQDYIRRHLHSSLERAHEECQDCENGADCPWIDRTCEFNDGGKADEDCPLQPPATGNWTVQNELGSRSADEEASAPAHSAYVTHDPDDNRSWSFQVALGWVYPSREALADVEKGEAPVAEADGNDEDRLQSGSGRTERADAEGRVLRPGDMLGETRDSKRRGISSDHADDAPNSESRKASASSHSHATNEALSIVPCYGVFLSAEALGDREEDIPTDSIPDVVDSDCPGVTYSSAEVLELADPSPPAAFPIGTSSQAAHPTSETAQNVQAFGELPFRTSAALDHQSTADLVPPDMRDALPAFGSHGAGLAEHRVSEHAAQPPGEPHWRESDPREDAPPTVPGSSSVVLQAGTAVLHDAEPIISYLAQSSSRHPPAGDPDVQSKDAADDPESTVTIVDPTDDSGGHSVAPEEMNGAGGTDHGGGDDVEGGGRPGRSQDAATDREPNDVSDSPEQRADPIVEQHDSEGELTRFGKLAGGMGVDVDEER